MNQTIAIERVDHIGIGWRGLLRGVDHLLRCLSHNNYVNNVSRMLENVLTRFTRVDRD